ncbi:MAG: sugar ABC transporter permease [Ruminococcus sp.]|nr:sugar ABC transporter permease [Ruminococcus sp.]
MASTAQSRIKSISYAKYGYMFIAPFFIVYAFFQVWPLINTFILSLHGNGLAAQDTFVGMDNFKDLLFGGDSRSVARVHSDFFRDLGNTVLLWVGNFILQIFLSLLLAVWFTDSKLHIPGQGFFKVVMYLPNIITAVSVAALFMRFFSNSSMCLANSLISGEAIRFEDSAVWSRAIVMFIQTWMWFGNTMIMMMSGILGINPSLFEAAAIDGASSGQVLTKITLPLLRPMVVYTLITSMIGGLQMFDIPYLYHTSPNTVNPLLETAAVFVYSKFRVNPDKVQYGYAGAASIVLFLITALLGLIVFRMNRDEDEHRKKKERKALIKAYKQEQKMAKAGGID